MRPYWTVPFDDILTVRFRTGMVCAQPADEMDLWSAPSGEALAIALCKRCAESDPTGRRGEALVEEHAQQRRLWRPATPGSRQPGACAGSGPRQTRPDLPHG